jgi:2-C-methyl-D-erythritol 4-phosphate cytidylyltransferase
LYSAIILAGGVGARMHQAMPKQFLSLAGKPLIMHTLERLEQVDRVGEIVVVCHPGYRELLQRNIDAYLLKKKYVLTDGGSSRQESTYLGLLAASYDKVMIHEAARPFVTKEEFEALADEPCDSAIYGIPIPFTVSKQEGGYLSGLLERRELINVQLPQKFPREAILEAHRRAREEGKAFTEDASILYHYTGCRVKVLEGTPFNLKITEPIDLISGENIYQEYIIGRN